MMVPWFLRDPERFAREASAIERLAKAGDWLTGYDWNFAPDLCLDAVVRAHGFDYELRVTFPSYFPDSPAVVCPRNADARLSGHQYGGADGPLCLEWGPDNWHADLTAADLLESAYRLFEIENPHGRPASVAPVIAPSRHRLTVGQELRWTWSRCYTSPALASFLNSNAADIGSFKFSFRRVGDVWVALVHEAKALADEEPWRDSIVPNGLPEVGDLYEGAYLRCQLDSASADKIDSLEKLTQLVPLDTEGLLAVDGSSPIPGFSRSITGVLLLDRDGGIHFFLLLSGLNLYRCTSVVSEPTESRLLRDPEIGQWRGKKVGIVGLGSAGSKMAITLTRMGCRAFFLCDHDVLLPENLVRHALDWQFVGVHKADAISLALSRIAPDTRVEVSKLHLTGQESNAAVNGALAKLGDCDLLIDATANQQLFNLIAAIARYSKLPLVWLEVFGGGIGGLIARSRPGIDPPPQDIRLAYLEYCAQNPVPEGMRQAKRYELAQIEDMEPSSASDADVSVISHLAASLASDCLRESAEYPYSLYLIGLREGWVFTQPLETIPIPVAVIPSRDSAESTSASVGDDLLQRLLDRREG